MKKNNNINVYRTIDAWGVPVWMIDSNKTTDKIIESLAANGTYVPGIEHVTYNNGMKTDKSHIDPKTGKKVIDAEHAVRTTVVDYDDGTRTIVTCSQNDCQDDQTAIVNSIAKRIYGKVTDTGTIDGNGAGIKIRKIAEAGFDQTNAAERIKASKAKVKAEHEARQKAAHDAAYAKKVKRNAESLQILLDALKQIQGDVSSILPNQSYDPVKDRLVGTVDDLNSAHTCKCGCCKHETDDEYVRPNKKFKDFTQDEKREYWRWQNKNRSKA